MAEPDWFMNLLFWWIYGIIQNIVVQLIGFWFAVFGDPDWGRLTMEGIAADLPMMDGVISVIGEGSYGS